MKKRRERGNERKYKQYRSEGGDGEEGVRAFMRAPDIEWSR